MKSARNTEPMPPIRVLHICNWYPSLLNPNEAPFIRRHVGSLKGHFENTAWHIAVNPNSGKWSVLTKNLFADRTRVVQVPRGKSILIEWATFALVTWAWLTRRRSVKFDLVNIHITYPLGIRVKMLRRMFGVPVVFTEHWSAYHYSFRSKSKGLERTRAMFRHGVPLICVSASLLNDIEDFSGAKQHQVAIIDNVAESEVFYFDPESSPQEGRFLAISGWRHPKRPDLLIRMIALLRDSGINAHLRLGGDGPQMEAIKAAIVELGLETRVTLLGRLGPSEVAKEIRQAHAFLHPSEYETYSAVCAESLCCGTPVLASDVGGVGEYLAQAPGSALVPAHDAHVWKQALMANWSRMLSVDRRSVSRYMLARASPEMVGKRYSDFLKQILAGRG